MIARLLGTDYGPISNFSGSYWKEKVISASSNIMMVEFKSDNEWEYKGFSATIRFNLLNNTKCESWMDMNDIMLQSPSFPNSYGNNIFCNHLITVKPAFHITLDFLEFDVGFNHCIFILFTTSLLGPKSFTFSKNCRLKKTRISYTYMKVAVKKEKWLQTWLERRVIPKSPYQEIKCIWNFIQIVILEEKAFVLRFWKVCNYLIFHVSKTILTE